MRDDCLLLILDLDETLIHATSRLIDRQEDFRVGPYHVYKRPYLERFLLRVVEQYRLAVWSSASAAYVAKVVRAIIPPGIDTDFQWSERHCVYRRDPESGGSYWLKDLKKVKRRGYDLNRILIVDDEPGKLRRNYGNAIYVKPYEGARDDNELLLLLKYLESLSDAKDIRKLEKRDWRRQVEE